MRRRQRGAQLQDFGTCFADDRSLVAVIDLRIGLEKGDSVLQLVGGGMRRGPVLAIAAIPKWLRGRRRHAEGEKERSTREHGAPGHGDAPLSVRR